MKAAFATCFAVAALLPIVALAQAARPAVTTVTSDPVRVTNSVNGAVHVSDVNKPAHTPFSKRLDVTFAGGFGATSFTVPAGKVLVITYVSASVITAVGNTAAFGIGTTYAGSEVEAHLPVVSNGTLQSRQNSSSSERVTVYADPGSTVSAFFLVTPADTGGAIVGIYGYLVDSTAASFE